MTRFTGYCFVTMLALAGQVAAQVENILDLTTPEVRQKDKARTRVCGSVGGVVVTSGGVVPEPELGLALQLESLNRGEYKIGEEVVAVLRLTNIGAKPLMIPWSPDPETIFGRNCEWRPGSPGVIALNGMISLEFRHQLGFEQFIASHGLYGNSKRPHTCRTLARGESAFVKIWGTVGFYNIIQKRREKGLEFKLPQDFVVSASFDLDDSTLRFPYKTLRSKNEVRVRVSGE